MHAFRSIYLMHNKFNELHRKYGLKHFKYSQRPRLVKPSILYIIMYKEWFYSLILKKLKQELRQFSVFHL